MRAHFGIPRAGNAQRSVVYTVVIVYRADRAPCVPFTPPSSPQPELIIDSDDEDEIPPPIGELEEIPEHEVSGTDDDPPVPPPPPPIKRAPMRPAVKRSRWSFAISDRKQSKLVKPPLLTICVSSGGFKMVDIW
jgi:hypothetical protein